MSSTGNFTQYSGRFDGVSKSGSPGLRFLAVYVEAIDALDRESTKAKQLVGLISPSTNFITNGGEPSSLSQVEGMFVHRAAMLSRFTHAEHAINATDLAHDDDDGCRTVICETTSRLKFSRNLQTISY